MLRPVAVHRGGGLGIHASVSDAFTMQSSLMLGMLTPPSAASCSRTADHHDVKSVRGIRSIPSCLQATDCAGTRGFMSAAWLVDCSRAARSTSQRSP